MKMTPEEIHALKDLFPPHVARAVDPKPLIAFIEEYAQAKVAQNLEDLATRKPAPSAEAGTTTRIAEKAVRRTWTRSP